MFFLFTFSVRFSGFKFYMNMNMKNVVGRTFLKKIPAAFELVLRGVYSDTTQLDVELSTRSHAA